MARIHIVPDDLFGRIAALLGDGGNVVLIPQSLANQQDLKNRLKQVDMSGYDCGGEADVGVDLVLTPHDYFMTCLEGRERAQQG